MVPGASQAVRQSLASLGEARLGSDRGLARVLPKSGLSLIATWPQPEPSFVTASLQPCPSLAPTSLQPRPNLAFPLAQVPWIGGG